MSTRLVYFGSSEFGLPALKALAQDQRFTLVGVVSQPPKPRSRGHQLEPTPIATWAANQSLPLITPTTLKDEEAPTLLQEFGADVWVVIAYGLILPANLLQLPPQGAINVHGSLLPRHRGASPIAASLVAGDTETGVSIMLMDPGVDTGPVLAEATLPINTDDTAVTVGQRLSQLAANELPDVVANWISGSLEAKPQDNSRATLAPKLTKEDGHATWDAVTLWERKIRAYQPWPGVWTNWRDQGIKLLAAQAHPGQPKLPLGSVVEYPTGSWSIVCQDGWLEPTEVQFAGRRPQPAKSIPGSYPGFLGSVLR